MSRKPKKPNVQSRSAARLLAVQALYDASITGVGVDALLKDFIDHKIGGHALITDEDENETDVDLVEADPLLFAALVRGAMAQSEQLDLVIGNALSGDWSVERLESVLHAILRAGAFELTAMAQTPVRVVISEYVDVASAFYGGPEPGLVNAVLDRIARVVRATELGADGRA